MKKRYIFRYLMIFFLAGSSTVFAQGTYDQVYHLLNTKCANYACHDGSTATFNASLPADSLYASLVNVTPVNPAAATNFNKLVTPGDVQRSFLLRKIAHGISSGLNLNQPSEGLDMPNGLPALKNYEIELVRQWILFGAPDTGTVVDTSVINTFYRQGGITDTYSPHNPPATGTGFQVYVGTIFLKPNTEVEYFIKYDPHLTASIEIPEFVTMLPSVTHHFVAYCFQTGADVLYRAGIRPISESSMNSVTFGIGGGPGYQDMVLPTGTAFFYAAGQILDIDFHFNNPSLDSVLATDLYVNYLPQPLGTAQHYMIVNNWVNQDIVIPHDGVSHSFTAVSTDSTQTQYYKIWKMWSHTHKYGTGFNIWLRNPDGTKGALMYDGNYSYEQGYNTGYYRWGSHSTIRTWAGDSLFEWDPRLGFIYEATFKNTAGPDTVWYGPTAADEMDVMGFASISGDNLPTTGIAKVSTDEFGIKIFPNPTSDEFIVTYELASPENVQIDITDILGKHVANLFNGMQASTGKYTRSFDAGNYKLEAGTYFVTFNIGGKIATEKLMITN